MASTPPADRFAMRAADEAARVAACEARLPVLHIDTRHDPAVGLQFVFENVGASTVVAIRPDAGSLEARWMDAATLQSLATWAATRNAAGWNLYFTLNQPIIELAKKPTKAEITELRGVFADVDAKAGRTLEQARATVLRLPTPPSFIIASGGGFQPVWLLNTPLQSTPESVAEAEAVGRRLAALAEGDPVQNVDRILRLPFTLNHPNARKRKAGRGVSVSGLLRGGAHMARYTLAEIAEALPADPEGAKASTRSAVQLAPGGMPRSLSGPRLPDMNAAAHAGLPRTAFDALPPERMNELLAKILALPQIAAIANAYRAEWLRYLFALADAEYMGATEARRLARDWSARGDTFDQASFDQAWRSYKPGGVGVGTLLAAARDAGFGFAPWFHPAPASPVSALPPTGFMQRLPMGSTNLHAVPWLLTGFIMRGDLTVLAGQGGGGKTALAIHLAVALAAGCASWGPFRVNSRGTPLRVLYASGEEDGNRLGLGVEAACIDIGLTAAGRQAVAANLLIHDARASGWRLGEPRPGVREEMAPEGEDRMRDVLRDALAAQPVDMVVLDTLAGLLALPNENDNAAVTRMFNRLTRVVREANCACLLIHHTPKTTREGAAAQRGEPTLVRGGGAMVNSARVVWTLTGLAAAEAAAVAMTGAKPDAIRRLDPVKMNDCAPPLPAFLEMAGQMVTVADGSRQSIRTVRFVLPPPDPASGGGLPTATLNVVMRAIDAGVMADGARLPLSPGGGRTNARDAVRHVAQALRVGDTGLSDIHAKAAAKQALHQLQNVVGCIEVREVSAPKQAGGKANGKRLVKGLACRWELAPWAGAALAQVASGTDEAAAGQPLPAPPDTGAPDAT